MEYLSEEELNYVWVEEIRKRDRDRAIIPTQGEDDVEMARLVEKLELLPSYRVCSNCQGIIVQICCESHKTLCSLAALCCLCFIECCCQACGTFPSSGDRISLGLCSTCRFARGQVRNILSETADPGEPRDELYA